MLWNDLGMIGTRFSLLLAVLSSSLSSLHQQAVYSQYFRAPWNVSTGTATGILQEKLAHRFSVLEQGGDSGKEKRECKKSGKGLVKREKSEPRRDTPNDTRTLSVFFPFFLTNVFLLSIRLFQHVLTCNFLGTPAHGMAGEREV